MKMRLQDRVYGPDGSITTLAALLDSGQARLNACLFEGRGHAQSRRYFVEWDDPINGGVFAYEIGKLAFECRSGAVLSVAQYV